MVISSLIVQRIDHTNQQFKFNCIKKFQNINVFLSQSKQNEMVLEDDAYCHQIDALQFSQSFQSSLLFDSPHCFFAVVANDTLFIFKISSQQQLEIQSFEKIQLDTKAIHESILIQICPQTFNHLRALHIILMDVKGKIYFILIYFSENDLKLFSTSVQTLNEGIGCLSLKWIDITESIRQHYKMMQIDENQKCVCSILAQYNSSLHLIRCITPKIKNQNIQLPSFSKLVGITQKFNSNILFLQNGDGIVFNGQSIFLLKQPDMYSLNGVKSSTNNQLIIIGGQPDATQQKKGNIIMHSQCCSPFQLLSDILCNIMQAIKLQNGIPMITQPLNFDDVSMYLNSKISNTEFYISDILKMCLGLYDPQAVNIQSQSLKLKKIVDDIVALRRKITSQFGEDERIVVYVSSIALINLLLIQKADFEGWQEIYTKIYFSYLERVEETMRILLEIRQINTGVAERIKEIKQRIINQMSLLNQKFNIFENKFKYFNAPQKYNFQVYFDHLLKQNGHIYSSEFKEFQKCPICSIKLDKLQYTTCDNKHRFIRCNVTQIPLNDQKIVKCINCKLSMIHPRSQEFPLPYQVSLFLVIFKVFLLQEQVCPVCCCLLKTVL